MDQQQSARADSNSALEDAARRNFDSLSVTKPQNCLGHEPAAVVGKEPQENLFATVCQFLQEIPVKVCAQRIQRGLQSRFTNACVDDPARSQKAGEEISLIAEEPAQFFVARLGQTGD